jgi:hypothetical protein
LTIYLPSNGSSSYRRSRLALPTGESALAYIAGLFDGEGCITRANSYPIVQIGMTDRDVIEYLATLGGTIRVEQPPGNRKPLYRWRVMAGREVAEFLAAIFPFLRVKRQQAEDAIAEIQGKLLVLAGEA